ncbi:MAG: HDIG domain-containing protein [Rhodothermales bacterium]|nr:HDIG domain-containing protein [Rhodothermales bacterium]
MGWIKNVFKSRPRIRPVGERLERGRLEDPRLQQRNLIVKGSIFLGLVALTYLAFPRGDFYHYTLAEGDFWRLETLVAPFDFAIAKDPEVIESERRNVRFTTPPYFEEVLDASARMAVKRDTVVLHLDRVFAAYARFKLGQRAGGVEMAVPDSMAYLEVRRNARVKLTPNQWQLLVQSYAERHPDLAERRARGNRLDDLLVRKAWSVGAQLLSIGILDVPIDSVYTDEIYIRDEAESVVRTKRKESLFGLNEAFLLVRDEFSKQYPNNPDYVGVGEALFIAMFQHSLTYLRAETMREWQRKEQRISPTRGMVEAGSIIVENGEKVTREIKRRLTSLERAQQERMGRKLPWKLALGQLFLALATHLLFFLYLYSLRRQIYDDNRKVLLIALLFAGIIGSYAIAIRYPLFGMYAVPVAVAPVMLTVMFDSRVALFGLLTLALVGGHLLGYDFEFTFATIFACNLAVFSVRDIKNRGQIFLSAGMVFLGYGLVLGATWLMYDTPPGLFGEEMIRVGINSLMLIVSLPLLWIFERAFDITTDLTLLELSDTNRPLLKELSTRAPGTFSHSLQVANLAETAADAIGANALLARVGALYHDIGKMPKAEYFVENQRKNENPHDQIKPRMSALIIASHVKEGLEIGRQHNLPIRVLDFIPMHHGTTLIEYFYRKAEEHSLLESVQEGEFRYPGPRPQSRETGILMLADSVEAASRSLSEPTHKRLESLIDTIFRARMTDGQLDETDLTFSDLTIIKETFLSLLVGMHHARVKYPDQIEAEERERVAAAFEEHISGRSIE